MADFDENADYNLTEDTKVYRIETNIGNIFNNFSGEMDLTTFIKDASINYDIEAHYVESPMTAWWISGDDFIVAYIDVNKDGKDDYDMQIEANETDMITANTNCWILCHNEESVKL